MKRKIFVNLLLILLCILITNPKSLVYSEPRESQLEEALLQQLHPIIVSSLNNIYKEKYSQFSCERILSINERVTMKNSYNKARPVDAIHGAKYFEITIGLCRPDGDYVFRNDLFNPNVCTNGH